MSISISVLLQTSKSSSIHSLKKKKKINPLRVQTADKGQLFSIARLPQASHRHHACDRKQRRKSGLNLEADGLEAQPGAFWAEDILEQHGDKPPGQRGQRGVGGRHGGEVAEGHHH